MKDLEVLEHMKEHYKNQLEGAERQQAQANKRCKEGVGSWSIPTRAMARHRTAPSCFTGGTAQR